ncbi:sulfotransferase domain-containing protein [Nocardioides sp. Y6]|uniref:Sulfotransferase domain-containing protein n=1 Tax=Nocardioides malaquae TaxID=2773426 RepID=A0ABR9RQY3_9ACTN|nr:sulfotransferase domain-containing protein [Nocardioides malaquae]MBE7323978.1 sulfotransferase domain-containing protein [Nocardioides malaquae]
MVSFAQLKDRSPRWVKDAANVATRAAALATASQRPAPDFLVIGTKRGGTTSLHNYLLMHPGVLGLFPQSRGKKSTDWFFADSTHSESWYRSHFHTEAHRERVAARVGHPVMGGEASPYYVWDPRIAAKVAAVAPSVKAVMLVRDPVERAWSHYQERTQNGVEPLDFAAALAAEDQRLEGELERMAADPGYHSTAHDWYSYRSRGVYLPQIQNWLQHFDRKQLLVLRSEDLYTDVQAGFDAVCDFLGLGSHTLPTTRTFNASHRKSSVPEPQRSELARFFAPHNAALADFLGRDLDWT